MPNSRPWSNRLDIWILLALCIPALLIWILTSFSTKSGQYATVYYNGQAVLQVSLAENRSFSIEELPEVVFEVRDGAIAFRESNCPDHTCIRTGFISHPGQTAVCLPNHLELRIESADDSPDIIVSSIRKRGPYTS